jgi:hypothetical protein
VDSEPTAEGENAPAFSSELQAEASRIMNRLKKIIRAVLHREFIGRAYPVCSAEMVGWFSYGSQINRRSIWRAAVAFFRMIYTGS